MACIQSNLLLDYEDLGVLKVTPEGISFKGVRTEFFVAQPDIRQAEIAKGQLSIRALLTRSALVRFKRPIDHFEGIKIGLKMGTKLAETAPLMKDLVKRLRELNPS